MYFKKLEIFGFKSFADKTVLHFERGITAVVGPNGCGKSNVFDSIRWVLGEQSAKELRGGAMEDVIFNGTDKKSSLGFAEVNLTLSNESRSLPIEYDEVTITRRLFRSGESEYLLNKTVVRLRDIQEMLMGTGIGAEAYSLVQQGKVDLVVSARPEERRMIFDEASGITKYKSKKKEALSKLKETDDNLLRVNDITIEVKRQIASIERQANKARKYKEEFEKLKDLEVKLARYEIDSYLNQKESIRSEIERMSNDEVRLNQEHDELSNQLTHEINFLDDIEDQINEIRSEEIKLDGQIDLYSRQIGFHEERIQNLDETAQKIQREKSELIERCRIQKEKIEEINNSLAGLEENLRYQEGQLNVKREELVILDRSIRDAKEKIQHHEEKIVGLASQQGIVRNQLTDTMKEMQGCLARARRLELEKEKVSSEMKEEDLKLQTAGQQILELEEKMSARRQDQELVQVSINDLKIQASSLEAEIVNFEKQRLFLVSQKEFIAQLQTQYEGMPDPIVEGKLLIRNKPQDHHTGIIGKVKEVKEAEQSGFLSFGKNSSEIMYEIVCETKFIEIDPEQISSKIDGISRIIELKSLDKENLLQQIRLKESDSEKVEEDLHNLEKIYSVLEAQKRDMIDETRKLTGEIDLVDTELAQVRETLSQLTKKEEELNFQLESATQDLLWCQQDIRDKQTWITAKSDEKECFSVTVAQLETELGGSRDKIQHQKENQKLYTETLDSWLEGINKIDEELTEQEEKRQVYKRENEELLLKVDEVKASQESIHQQITEQEAQKIELSHRINSIRSSVKSIEDDLEKNRQDKYTVQLQEQQLAFNEKSIKDRLMQTYKIDFDQLTMEGVQTAIENAETAEAETGVVVSAPLSMEELAAEAERLRKRCEAYGAVNLVAIDEFEELKQRFEFLTKQQSDLLEAKSQLMNTITKINKSTRQMFLDTFTKVGEEFRIYFRMLFGGGEAQLILLDPENVLESGIEIVARPPGKKLQSISLLSGGEKTLTAIALIFGVFKVNPSPFCILDEIDAALDESNVGRFSYLLKEFSKIAQFIVITHNKKTIASADVMYGITMPETGVSRVVSVRFSDEKKKAETIEEAVASV
jgi:chromosome segregation protein